MTVTMVYLITLLSPWRLASLADDDYKAAKLKTTMATEGAAELSNWSAWLRGFIRALIRH